jgi:hypothetical protein
MRPPLFILFAFPYLLLGYQSVGNKLLLGVCVQGFPHGGCGLMWVFRAMKSTTSQSAISVRRPKERGWEELGYYRKVVVSESLPREPRL